MRTSTPVTIFRVKPDVGATVTVYLPGGKLGTVKLPSLPVTYEASVPVASFFTVIVAPETICPLGSVMVPFNVPVVAWAITASLKTKIIVRDIANAPRSANDFAMGGFLIFFSPNVVSVRWTCEKSRQREVALATAKWRSVFVPERH
jgi:hypothetical protein